MLVSTAKRRLLRPEPAPALWPAPSHVTTVPSVLSAVKLQSEETIFVTFTSPLATEVLFPPQSATPQVSTLPSLVSAAKAPVVEYTAMTPTRLLLTLENGTTSAPETILLPQLITVPSPFSAAKDLAAGVTLETFVRRLLAHPEELLHTPPFAPLPQTATVRSVLTATYASPPWFEYSVAAPVTVAVGSGT